MERPEPPFRADHVGSLIRPQSLIDGRRALLAGALSAPDLHVQEDRAIREVVKLQEEVGLHAVTDGEFRRTSYLTEFLNPIGVELQSGKSPDMIYHDDAGKTAPASLALVSRRIGWTGSPNVGAFVFLKGVTSETAKVNDPGADPGLHLFAGRDGIAKSVLSRHRASF